MVFVLDTVLNIRPADFIFSDLGFAPSIQL